MKIPDFQTNKIGSSTRDQRSHIQNYNTPSVLRRKLKISRFGREYIFLPIVTFQLFLWLAISYNQLTKTCGGWLASD